MFIPVIPAILMRNKRHCVDSKTVCLWRIFQWNWFEKNWTESNRRSSGSMFRDFRILELCTFSINITPSFLPKNLILEFALAIVFFRSIPKTHDHRWEWGRKLFWKLRAQFFSSCLPSHINTTPRYLTFSTCFSDALLTYNEQWSEFLNRWSTLKNKLELTVDRNFNLNKHFADAYG